MLPPRYSTHWEQALGCSLLLPVITNLTTTATGKSLHMLFMICPKQAHSNITSCSLQAVFLHVTGSLSSRDDANLYI